jgi:hypothetical protein
VEKNVNSCIAFPEIYSSKIARRAFTDRKDWNAPVLGYTYIADLVILVNVLTHTNTCPHTHTHTHTHTYTFRRTERYA